MISTHATRATPITIVLVTMSTDQTNPPTAKLQDHSASASGAPAAAKPDPAKAPAALEEDDEFEDFPVEGMQPHQPRSWSTVLTVDPVQRRLARRRDGGCRTSSSRRRQCAFMGGELGR